MTLGFIAIVLKTNKLMKPQVEPGTTVAPEKYRIVIADGGPYLVYGQPPLVQQFIMPNGEGEIWYFKEGAHYLHQRRTHSHCVAADIPKTSLIATVRTNTPTGPGPHGLYPVRFSRMRNRSTDPKSR